MSTVDADIRDIAETPHERGRWSSRLAFVLAAAGSAVGLGSIWKFPYITGENGGGWFVAVYIGCIVFVALPIMIAEILIGRTTQRSPVGAFHALATQGSPWRILGWLSIAAGFLILSYYFVVAGWTLHYAWLAVSGDLWSGGTDASGFAAKFAAVHADPAINVMWQLVFIVMTAAVVIGGVRNGIERCCQLLLPLLLILMLALLVQVVGTPSFDAAVGFVFGLHGQNLSAGGVLEALGHSFFTLSLGMGAMITYGSYLGARTDVVVAGTAVAGIDTVVSLLACITLFPILFASALSPAAGPGLVFVSLPAAFAQMPGGTLWAATFFVVLAIAALSSTVSVFEVIVSHFVDENGLGRARACVITATALFAAGVPSALAGGTDLFGSHFGALTAQLGTARNWFDFVDFVASNWLLPLSGLGIAIFYAWRVGTHAREQAFRCGTRFAKVYWSWVWLLRYFVPPAVAAVFLHATGVIGS